MKVPFWLLPASWGLKGKTRERAEAEYMHSGLELELKLAAIDLEGNPYHIKVLDIQKKYGIIDNYTYDISKLKHEELTEKEQEIRLLDIKFEHGMIGEYDYHITKIPLLYSTDLEKKIAELDTNLHFGKITERQYQKTMFTLAKKPWVDIIKTEIDEETQKITGFELDWNEYFIEKIQEDGFLSPTQEECVDLWLSDQIKNAALSELQKFMTEDEIHEFDHKIKHTKRKSEDGKTTVS